MSLPIVFIFERHWDTIPKELLNELIQPLSENGYTHLCIEEAEDCSGEEFLEGVRKTCDAIEKHTATALGHLQELGLPPDIELSDIPIGTLREMLSPVIPHQSLNILSGRIKALPANKLLYTTLKKATDKMAIKTIDIRREIRHQISECKNIDEKWNMLQSYETTRMTTMAHNILSSLHEKEGGVIALVGAVHAKNIVDEIQRRAPQQKVVACFPHSHSNYGEYDDISDLLQLIPPLKEYVVQLATRDVTKCVQNLVSNVFSKISYIHHLPITSSHSQQLSEYFKVQCVARIRSGYYVDALFDVDEIQRLKIENKLVEYGLFHYRKAIDEKIYLVVNGINIKQNAEKIKRMSYSCGDY